MGNNTAPGLHVVGFDHVVLLVEDVERSLAFYRGDLGLDGVRVDEWRRDDAPFPSVRVDARTIIDLLQAPPNGPGSGNNIDHFCLVVELTDLQAIKDSGRFDVVEGPARRFGARGVGTSLYVRDPDANVIELRHY